MGPHFVELIVGDVEIEGLLGFGEGEPQSPPGAKFLLWAPQVAHGGGGVSRNEWVNVLIVIHGSIEGRMPWGQVKKPVGNVDQGLRRGG